jgi:hypothetical protein
MRPFQLTADARPHWRRVEQLIRDGNARRQFKGNRIFSDTLAEVSLGYASARGARLCVHCVLGQYALRDARKPRRLEKKRDLGQL